MSPRHVYLKYPGLGYKWNKLIMGLKNKIQKQKTSKQKRLERERGFYNILIFPFGYWKKYPAILFNMAIGALVLNESMSLIAQKSLILG